MLRMKVVAHHTVKEIQVKDLIALVRFKDY
jgi:hypothetical protein